MKPTNQKTKTEQQNKTKQKIKANQPTNQPKYPAFEDTVIIVKEVC